MEKSDLDDLASRFPYEKLYNVTALDSYQMEKVTMELLKLVRGDVFCKSDKNVKKALDFILLNLTYDENAQDHLLHLMFMTLKQIVKSLAIHNKVGIVSLESNRIFKVIEFVSNFQAFSKPVARICISTLFWILNQLDKIPDSASKLLLKVALKLREEKLSSLMIKLCKMVFLRFAISSDVFNFFALWLLEDSVKILSEPYKSANEDLRPDVLELLPVLWRLIACLVYHEKDKKGNTTSLKGPYQNSLKQLMKIAPIIIKLCCEKQLSKKARILLSIIVFDFLKTNGTPTEEVTDILWENVKIFPENIKSWPNTLYPSFYWICHLLYAHGREVWTPRQILNSISKLVYSREVAILSAQCLKSIFFIFSLAAKANSTKDTRQLGDDILNVTFRVSKIRLEHVLTIHSDQLAWLLARGNAEIKTEALRLWLTREDCDLSLVKNIVAFSRNEVTVLNILKNCSDALVTNRCTALIEELRNPDLIKESQLLLLNLLENATHFARFVRIQPNAHQCTEQVLQLLHIVTNCLPNISNMDTFKEICTYCRCLIPIFKKNHQQLHFFYANTMLLECLIIRMKNACVDLIIEVLKLLTVLLKLQAKNRGNRSLKHSTPTCDEIDLPTVLRNPKLEPDLCLNLACEVLKNASPFKLREKTIFQLMLALTGFSYDAKRLTRSYVCINEIIKQHRWMVNCPFLSSFVEYSYFSFTGRKIPLNFIKFLLTWIHLAQHNSSKCCRFLPDKNILGSCLEHAKTLKPQTVKRYLRIISDIYDAENIEQV